MHSAGFVWLRSDSEELHYVRCKLVPAAHDGDSRAPRYARVEAGNGEGSGAMVKLATSQIVPANAMDDVDDLGQLTHVHEAALLASLRARLSRSSAFSS